jgi:hypothetical protein
MASEKQIGANRANGRKAAGKPRNTNRSRLNAINHGLLAVGVTEIDDADCYVELLHKLREQFEPVGEIENYLVERIALCMIRVRRSVRLESEAITAALHPQRRSKSRFDEQMEQQLVEMMGETSIIDRGFQCQVTNEIVATLADVFDRYESSNERRLFKAIQELERLQLLRKRSAEKSMPALVTPTATA